MHVDRSLGVYSNRQIRMPTQEPTTFFPNKKQKFSKKNKTKNRFISPIKQAISIYDFIRFILMNLHNS